MADIEAAAPGYTQAQVLGPAISLGLTLIIMAIAVAVVVVVIFMCRGNIVDKIRDGYQRVPGDNQGPMNQIQKCP